MTEEGKVGLPEFCKHGHPANWYIDPTTNDRRCRACKKIEQLLRKERTPFVERQKAWMDPKQKQYKNDWNRHLRMEVLLSYGGKCSCCEEWRYEFLAIDHINGGGNKDRRERHGSKIEQWLKKNGYPAGFQVLCHNCNMALGKNGYCPHQEEQSGGSI